MRLRTKFAVGEIPHSEHPRPQCARAEWLCLNGKWEFYKEDAAGNRSYEGDILVPFSPEALCSGIEEGFSLERGAKLVYKRSICLSGAQLTGRTVLHFDAVDSECYVRVNGQEVGAHKGGFTAFSFDVSDYLHEGENTLLVTVFDEGTRNGGARGKQSDKRGGIWYTPQSGIWQTVWLEFMPKQPIETSAFA